jgi:hypothetical protein
MLDAGFLIWKPNSRCWILDLETTKKTKLHAENQNLKPTRPSVRNLESGTVFRIKFASLLLALHDVRRDR